MDPPTTSTEPKFTSNVIWISTEAITTNAHSNSLKRITNFDAVSASVTSQKVIQSPVTSANNSNEPRPAADDNESGDDHSEEEIDSDSNPNVCVVCSEVFRSLTLLLEHERTSHLGDEDEESFEETPPKSQPTIKIEDSLPEEDVKPDIRQQSPPPQPKVLPRQAAACDTTAKYPPPNVPVRITYCGNTKLYNCPICTQAFCNENYLRRHEEKHQKDKWFNRKLFVCPSCLRNFRNEADLEQHQRFQHSAVRPFGCGFCLRTFSSAQLLKLHMRIHWAALKVASANRR